MPFRYLTKFLGQEQIEKILKINPNVKSSLLDIEEKIACLISEFPIIEHTFEKYFNNGFLKIIYPDSSYEKVKQCVEVEKSIIKEIYNQNPYSGSNVSSEDREANRWYINQDRYIYCLIHILGYEPKFEDKMEALGVTREKIDFSLAPRETLEEVINKVRNSNLLPKYNHV